jgi:hypothetical protein
LCGLPIIEEDGFRQNIGGCPGPDLGHFLGHEPGMTKVHVGQWKNHTGRDDRDCYYVSITQDYALISLSQLYFGL